MDLRTGVGNSEARATFAHGRGCVCKLSALGRGAAGHFRAQAWYKTHIPFSWVGGAARPARTGKRAIPGCRSEPGNTRLSKDDGSMASKFLQTIL